MHVDKLSENKEKVQKLKFIREFSSGAVVFYKNENDERLYLLLHYRLKSDYWDFPRGNIDPGEHSIETAKREIREETGLAGNDIKFLAGFRKVVQWFYVLQGTRRFKQVTFFLSEANKRNIEISKEHLGYKWLSFDEALEQLTYNNAKQVLREAETFLNKET